MRLVSVLKLDKKRNLRDLTWATASMCFTTLLNKKRYPVQ